MTCPPKPWYSMYSLSKNIKKTLSPTSSFHIRSRLESFSTTSATWPKNQSGMALNGLHGINHQPFPKVEMDVNGCRNGIKLGKPRILLAEYPAEHQHRLQSLMFRYLQHDHVISNIWILAGYYVNESENVTTTHSRPWFSFQACFTQCIVWIPAR